MKKIFLVISLIWLFCGISGTIASAMGKDAGERPFVGRWCQLNEKGIFTLDLNLYRSKGRMIMVFIKLLNMTENGCPKISLAALLKCL